MVTEKSGYGETVLPVLTVDGMVLTVLSANLCGGGLPPEIPTNESSDIMTFGSGGSTK